MLSPPRRFISLIHVKYVAHKVNKSSQISTIDIVNTCRHGSFDRFYAVFNPLGHVKKSRMIRENIHLPLHLCVCVCVGVFNVKMDNLPIHPWKTWNIGVDGGWWVGDRKTQTTRGWTGGCSHAASTYLLGRDKKIDRFLDHVSWRCCWFQKRFLSRRSFFFNQDEQTHHDTKTEDNSTQCHKKQHSHIHIQDAYTPTQENGASDECSRGSCGCFYVYSRGLKRQVRRRPSKAVLDAYFQRPSAGGRRANAGFMFTRRSPDTHYRRPRHQQPPRVLIFVLPIKSISPVKFRQFNIVNTCPHGSFDRFYDYLPIHPWKMPYLTL